MGVASSKHKESFVPTFFIPTAPHDNALCVTEYWSGWPEHLGCTAHKALMISPGQQVEGASPCPNQLCKREGSFRHTEVGKVTFSWTRKKRSPAGWSFLGLEVCQKGTSPVST